GGCRRNVKCCRNGRGRAREGRTPVRCPRLPDDRTAPSRRDPARLAAAHPRVV
ncbi:MAG: hypothetical protein AVDCRST_MAG93-3700, partial [uncultured Chloroflexia bacterium]